MAGLYKMAVLRCTELMLHWITYLILNKYSAHDQSNDDYVPISQNASEISNNQNNGKCTNVSGDGKDSAKIKQENKLPPEVAKCDENDNSAFDSHGSSANDQKNVFQTAVADRDKVVKTLLECRSKSFANQEVFQNKTLRMLDSYQKITNVCNLISSDTFKLTNLTQDNEAGEKLVNSHTLQADSLLLLSLGAQLYAKMEQLIQASVSIPFSENTFVKRKNEVIYYCEVISKLTGQIMEELKLLPKGCYQDIDNRSENFLMKAAYEFLEQVRLQTNLGMHYLERFLFTDSPEMRNFLREQSNQHRLSVQSSNAGRPQNGFKWKLHVLVISMVLVILIVAGLFFIFTEMGPKHRRERKN